MNDIYITAEGTIPALQAVIAYDDVQVNKFGSNCYEIHAFLVPQKELAAGWTAPTTVTDFSKSPNYAGAAAIFGRDAVKCENWYVHPTHSQSFHPYPFLFLCGAF